MAQAPTLYDFDIQLSHVDRAIDQRLQFKTARHPSETLERVWLRALAFCLFTEDRLAFGPGLGDPDAPDLETRDYTGRLTRWIRVGKADPVKVQRAADQNAGAAIAVVFESLARLAAFVEQAKEQGVARLAAVELVAASPELLAALAAEESRRNKVSITLVGDHFYIDRAGKALDGGLERATA